MSEFQFKIGDKVRQPGWGPERFVSIEWVGDTSFGGVNEKGERKTYDHGSGQGRRERWKPIHPFKVGDLVRNSLNDYPWPAKVTRVWFDGKRPMVDCSKGRYTWSDSPAHRWEKWQKTYHFPFKVGDWIVRGDGEPVKVLDVRTTADETFACAPHREFFGGPIWNLSKESPFFPWRLTDDPSPKPAPVVKRWLVTTEERVPVEGESFLYASKKAQPFDDGCYRATCDFAPPGELSAGSRDVVTSVQPLTNLNDWIVGGDGK